MNMDRALKFLNIKKNFNELNMKEIISYYNKKISFIDQLLLDQIDKLILKEYAYNSYKYIKPYLEKKNYEYNSNMISYINENDIGYIKESSSSNYNGKINNKTNYYLIKNGKKEKINEENFNKFINEKKLKLK